VAWLGGPAGFHPTVRKLFERTKGFEMKNKVQAAFTQNLRQRAEEIRDIAKTFRDPKLRDRLERLVLDIMSPEQNCRSRLN
jgi:hypothetical protein